jgi:hypothetical protein
VCSRAKQRSLRLHALSATAARGKRRRCGRKPPQRDIADARIQYLFHCCPPIAADAAAKLSTLERAASRSSAGMSARKSDRRASAALTARVEKAANSAFCAPVGGARLSK